MPPLAIIAAAGVVGAGANIAASAANAGAAGSAAAKNAAAISANQATDTGLIQAQQQRNDQGFSDAKFEADSNLLAGAEGARNAVNNGAQANAGVYDTLSQQGQGLYQPTVDRGNQAGTAINALLGLSGDASQQQAAFQDWLGSTGYQFNLQSGANAISSNAATKGLITSGGNLKALSDYGQQTGANYFGNYLAGLQGQQSTGLSAANALSGVYGNVAAGKAANNTNQANALSTISTNLGTNIANTATGTAGNIANYDTSLTNGLVTGNTAATNAQVGNTNNALAQTVSSNNSAANAVSGLAGNLASGYGYSQGASSYSQPNPLANGNNVTTGSSYKLATGGVGV